MSDEITRLLTEEEQMDFKSMPVPKKSTALKACAVLAEIFNQTHHGVIFSFESNAKPFSLTIAAGAVGNPNHQACDIHLRGNGTFAGLIDELYLSFCDDASNLAALVGGKKRE